MPNIILASQSPRRKEILEQVGVKFTIIPSEKEEIITSSDPVAVVRELAYMKADDIASMIEEDALIIGTDTVVVYNNQILGKPRDEAHAKEMLRELQNQVHEVYSGVALIEKKEGQVERTWNFSVCTQVGFCEISEEQIERYVATGEPMDKAGAYGIQGKFAIYINQLVGDYYNVVGLPISRIYEVLMENGIDLLEKDS